MENPTQLLVLVCSSIFRISVDSKYGSTERVLRVVRVVRGSSVSSDSTLVFQPKLKQVLVSTIVL